MIATGDLVDEIGRLKNQNGKDIIVYGGADFVANLIKNKLIDEFHFLVNPTLLGSGMTIFKNLTQSDLQLKNTIGFECGISILNYELRQE
ncbi:MAG: dihydrofolate reductase family protein [Mangrovibacterium sp.]